MSGPTGTSCTRTLHHAVFTRRQAVVTLPCVPLAGDLTVLGYVTSDLLSALFETPVDFFLRFQLPVLDLNRLAVLFGKELPGTAIGARHGDPF
jgi:hypothetical protein